MAGAEVQIEAAIQLVAETGGGGGGAVGHVELGVGGEEGVGGAEAVAEFSMQLAGERRGAAGQVGGGGEIPGLQVEAGAGSAALAEGRLQGHGEPFASWASQEGEATADAPLAAIVAKEQHPRGCGPAEAPFIGKPAEAATQLRGGGIGTAEQQGQICGRSQAATVEGDIA